jgi:hypothetical protein
VISSAVNRHGLSAAVKGAIRSLRAAGSPLSS